MRGGSLTKQGFLAEPHSTQGIPSHGQARMNLACPSLSQPAATASVPTDVKGPCRSTESHHASAELP